MARRIVFVQRHLRTSVQEKRKEIVMFNFFKKRAKSKRHSTTDFYELNEQEMDMLMGGSPVRSLIGGDKDTMLWPTSQRYDGSTYQSLLTPSFSPDMNRQRHLDWVSMVEDKTPHPSKFYN
jgi:hypothetical protein